MRICCRDGVAITVENVGGACGSTNATWVQATVAKELRLTWREDTLGPKFQSTHHHNAIRNETSPYSSPD